MKPVKYESPDGFKQATEQRLRTSSTSGVDFARRRQILVFDRFVARVVQVMGNTAILKGGLALEFPCLSPTAAGALRETSCDAW